MHHFVNVAFLYAVTNPVTVVEKNEKCEKSLHTLVQFHGWMLHSKDLAGLVCMLAEALV